MRITIDVSAAIEVVMGGKRQEEIINILNDADWVIAPSFFMKLVIYYGNIMNTKITAKKIL